MAAPPANWSIDAFDASTPEMALSIGAVPGGKAGIPMGNMMGSPVFD